MSDAPLEITVVYDAAGKKRRGIKHVAAKPARAKRGRSTSAKDASSIVASGGSLAAPRVRSRGGFAMVLLSILTLGAAGGLTYATWWPADQFIYEALILRTPIPGMDIEQVAITMFGGVAAPAGVGKATVGKPKEAAAILDEPTPAMFTGKTATGIIGGTAYAWLGLSTVACVLLTLSAGAGFAGVRRRLFRGLGWLATIAGACAIAWGAYQTWQEFGRQYPPDHLRWGMVALVAIAFFVGCALAPNARRMLRASGVLLLVTAVSSVIALCLGRLCGAVEPQYLAPAFLGAVFAIHSAWAWILLLFGSKV